MGTFGNRPSAIALSHLPEPPTGRLNAEPDSPGGETLAFHSQPASAVPEPPITLGSGAVAKLALRETRPLTSAAPPHRFPNPPQPSSWASPMSSPSGPRR